MCVYKRSKVNGFLQRKRNPRLTSTMVKIQRWGGCFLGRSSFHFNRMPLPAIWESKTERSGIQSWRTLYALLRTVNGSPFIGFKQMYLNAMVTGQNRAFNMHSSRLLRELAPLSKQHKSQNSMQVLSYLLTDILSRRAEVKRLWGP